MLEIVWVVLISIETDQGFHRDGLAVPSQNVLSDVVTSLSWNWIYSEP